MKTLMTALCFSLLLVAASSRADESPEQATCVLTSPMYSVGGDGARPDRVSSKCHVTQMVEDGESRADTCVKVLNCLNNPLCVNVSYCEYTTIRGNWSLIEVR